MAVSMAEVSSSSNIPYGFRKNSAQFKLPAADEFGALFPFPMEFDDLLPFGGPVPLLFLSLILLSGLMLKLKMSSFRIHC